MEFLYYLIKILYFSELIIIKNKIHIRYIWHKKNWDRRNKIIIFVENKKK
jgi:hypothetical protein